MTELKLPEPDTHCLDDEGGRPIDVWSYSPELVREILAQQSVRHAEELAAYELRCSNLQAELAGVVLDVDEVMVQSQVMASAWSLVGGRFDNGGAMQDFEEAKQELRAMLSAATAPQPERKPMTLAEAQQLLIDQDSLYSGNYGDDWSIALIRLAEAFHGIKETP